MAALVTPGAKPTMSAVPPSARNVGVRFTGLAAQPEHLHMINRFKGDDPRNQVPISGVEGAYRVVFVFARPGFNLLPEGNHSFAQGLRGNSHLAIAKPAFSPSGNSNADHVLIQGRTEDGFFLFRGLPNDRGFLGEIESDPFRAKDHADAVARLIAPLPHPLAIGQFISTYRWKFIRLTRLRSRRAIHR